MNVRAEARTYLRSNGKSKNNNKSNYNVSGIFASPLMRKVRA